MMKSFLYTLKQAATQVVRNKTMALTSLFSITAMLLILGMFFYPRRQCESHDGKYETAVRSGGDLSAG